MFRVTTTTNPAGELVVKVEGALAVPWVAELEACWREIVPALAGRRVRVDVTSVCHVDDAGRNLMTRMYRAGAQFVARGCVMPELVREIAEDAAAGGVESVRVSEEELTCRGC